MKELGRNNPCPCGSGKKVKKCCPERLEKPSPAALQPSPSRVHRRVLSTRGSHPVVPRDAQAWPVVRAYVPTASVWRATGLGTAGFVRQQPDGQLAYAFFLINLLEHGLTGMFGKNDSTLADLDRMTARLADKCPPMEIGPPETAAQFIWGALAVAESEAHGFPADQTAPYLALVPPLRGTVQTWRARLVDDESMTPQELVRVIRANDVQDEVPDGREVMILTEMTFDVVNVAAADALRCAGPDFDETGRDGEVEVFDWTREYPKGHWSPLSRLGGRQRLGTVRVDSDSLVAEAQTLSMAAQLAHRLHGVLGDTIRLRHTKWTGAAELLSRSSG